MQPPVSISHSSTPNAHTSFAGVARTVGRALVLVREEDRRETLALKRVRAMLPRPVDHAEGVADVEGRGARVLEAAPDVVADREERRAAHVVAVPVGPVPGAGVNLDGRPAEVRREGLRRDGVD